MNDSNTPRTIPASLVKIRCFLNRRGMKVKPWLGPKPVLDAFYAALRAQTHNDTFWSELHQLMHELAVDMNLRAHNRGWVVENELLDEQTHAELLSQIRSALQSAAASEGGLHRLAARVPRHAGALLLMLAAAMLVGCDDVQPANGQEPGIGAGGTSASSNGGTTLHGNGGTTLHGNGAMGGTTARSTTAVGGSISISISTDSSRAQSCPSSGPNSGLDAANFAACNRSLVDALIPYDLHSQAGAQLLECVCLLNDAWQSGLAELFAGKSCDEIAQYFGDCGIGSLCSTPANEWPAEFDADLLLDNCAVLLYLGVRCD